MYTDRPPIDEAPRTEFFRSDSLDDLGVPDDERLIATAKSIEAALRSSQKPAVRKPCNEFVASAADFYEIRRPTVKVLAVRPLRVREGGWASELFGDYEPGTGSIRVWMRTAVRKQVTSYGTFLSTLCHEFCHHLDYALFGFRDSLHTRGFYERAAVLYHHARGTPRKRLFWTRTPGGRLRIDWPRTNRGG